MPWLARCLRAPMACTSASLFIDFPEFDKLLSPLGHESSKMQIPGTHVRAPPIRFQLAMPLTDELRLVQRS